MSVFIELTNIRKSFFLGGNEIKVLKGINLKIGKGEFVSIVGPSGNGKSTLLNMITGIDKPTKGTVVIGGKEVHEMNENELARWRGQNVGIIFQFFQMLPSLTLLQNIVLPMEFAGKYKPIERNKIALELLDSVGIADQAHKLPSMVSGGQQQRAAIARALANDPELIIADEPTGNLDSANANAIFNLFKDLVKSKNKTMLMVTHETSLAKQVSRNIEIIDGQINKDEQNDISL